MLFSTLCGHEKGRSKLYWYSFDSMAQKLQHSTFFDAAHTLAWRKINHPVLVLEASPHNIREPSWINLLPSHHSKGNSSLRTFSHLEKVAIISTLVN